MTYNTSYRRRSSVPNRPYTSNTDDFYHSYRNQQPQYPNSARNHRYTNNYNISPNNRYHQQSNPSPIIYYSSSPHSNRQSFNNYRPITNSYIEPNYAYATANNYQPNIYHQKSSNSSNNRNSNHSSNQYRSRKPRQSQSRAWQSPDRRNRSPLNNKKKQNSKKYDIKKSFPIFIRKQKMIEFEEYFIDKLGSNKKIEQSLVFIPHYQAFNELPLPIEKTANGHIIGIGNCFNCGSTGHILTLCLQRRDRQCINFNRHMFEIYSNAKRGGSKRTYKRTRKVRYYVKEKNKKNKLKKNEKNGNNRNISVFDNNLLRHCTSSDLEKNVNDKTEEEENAIEAFSFLRIIPKLRILKNKEDIQNAKKDDEKSDIEFQKDDRDNYGSKYRDQEDRQRRRENENLGKRKFNEKDDFRYRRAVKRRKIK